MVENREYGYSYTVMVGKFIHIYLILTGTIVLCKHELSLSRNLPTIQRGDKCFAHNVTISYEYLTCITFILLYVCMSYLQCASVSVTYGVTYIDI